VIERPEELSSWIEFVSVDEERALLAILERLEFRAITMRGQDGPPHGSPLRLRLRLVRKTRAREPMPEWLT
jgi:hypothetical protein